MTSIGYICQAYFFLRGGCLDGEGHSQSNALRQSNVAREVRAAHPRPTYELARRLRVTSTRWFGPFVSCRCRYPEDEDESHGCVPDIQPSDDMVGQPLVGIIISLCASSSKIRFGRGCLFPCAVWSWLTRLTDWIAPRIRRHSVGCPSFPPIFHSGISLISNVRGVRLAARRGSPISTTPLFGPLSYDLIVLRYGVRDDPARVRGTCSEHNFLEFQSLVSLRGECFGGGDVQHVAS